MFGSVRTGATVLKERFFFYVGGLCRSVTVADGKIFAFVWPNFNTAEILVYDFEGNRIETKLDVGTAEPTFPHCSGYSYFSRTGDKIFITDWETNCGAVRCLTRDGAQVYDYRDDEFRHPCELFVDDYDNVIVCNGYYSTLEVISAAGKKHRTLLSSDDGISGPQCVSFRPSDGTLVVCCGYDHLIVFKLSK